MDEAKPVVLAETQYLRLIQDGHWTYAQRPNVTGAIAIVAVTMDEQLLLVDQFRIPLRARVIELPAGLVGDEVGKQGESLEDAAQRELMEEAGYRAGQWQVLTTGVSSAGLSDESIHLMYASNLTRVGQGGGLANEDIRVCHVPLVDVADWLKSQQRQGRHIDFKVYAALFLLQVVRGSN